MLQIRTMSNDDLPFAVKITGQMGWNLAEGDFNFMIELEPEGCFVAVDDSERIGLATTISYGDIGWFGNLVVNDAYRNRGTGSKLVKHSIEYLLRKHVKTVGLYAYDNRIHFYKRLDFKYDSDFIVMTGKGFPSQSSSNARKVQESDIASVVEFDESCFGSSRRKLLEPILLDNDNICYTITENDHVLAYAAAKMYRGMAELGPLVCSAGRDNLSIELLKAILDKLEGIEVSLFLPTKESTIINMLEGKGFTREFRVARMFHGQTMVKNCIQTAESLERG